MGCKVASHCCANVHNHATTNLNVEMTDQIRISAKNLGQVALPGFCERCFWVKLKLNNRLPYQIFPGIFSSIDAYSKRVIHAWFDKHNTAPPCLKDLGEIVGYREPPHFSKFNINDRRNNILLTGNPDGVLIHSDRSHIIVDYKTAKFTKNQDELYPMYEAQLNAYAFIGEQRGLSTVTNLALVYTEPVTDETTAAAPENHVQDGFTMKFSAYVRDVKLDPEVLTPLLETTRRLYDLETSPDSRANCEDCIRLGDLVDLASI